ncbi:IST1-like protein, partial [Tanacetum coccineum]
MCIMIMVNTADLALSVDQVIKVENVLDVYVMLDDYCHLVLQMFSLIEQEKDCPDELKEAASSLLYAAPRCGEFSELQEIRVVLTARYGKEFSNGAIDLRNNCGVSTR